MRLVAGVDVGNSTTEVVVIDGSGRPLAWDRRPTRGRKGSPESGAAAARLLTRLVRRLGEPVAEAVLTEQHPVETMTREREPLPAPTGRARVLASTGLTPGGSGFGVGRPVDTEHPPRMDGPVVLVSRDPLGFRRTADRVAAWRSAGADVVGILLAGDEGRLVSARVGGDLPVLDCVDPDAALGCALIALEVAAPGAQVRQVSDPIALSGSLGLSPEDHPSARAAAEACRSARAAAIGLTAAPAELRAPERPDAWPIEPVDTWTVDLAALESLPGLRPGAVARPSAVTAALLPSGRGDDHIAAFAEDWAGATIQADSEVAASRRGALTTPGARDDACIIDLGGGTVDVSWPGGARTVAGSGVLLTSCVADVLGVPNGLAEWVKRGPASRVDTPHLLVRETGERDLLDVAATAGTVGWLVAPGPSGDLPFSRSLQLAEWRALRRAAKRACLADNLARAVEGLVAPGTDVLLVGGPAGDDEAVDIVNEAVPGVIAGRADVAGRLGHRWAVAYGLACTALSR